MVVQHNLSAMNSNRQLGITNKILSKSTEKLSSGYQINRAADDAAGLSISEKMRKQIRGLSQAGLNAEDGISMVQTADGALEEVHDMLQRMNELCVQAANGTNATSDRQNIQDEVTQLITEIDRVAETTRFNEISLLDGSIANPGAYARAKAEYAKRIGDTKAKLDAQKAAMVTALNGKNKGQTFSLDEIKDNKGINIVYEAITDDAVTTTPVSSLGTYESTVNNPYLEGLLKNSLVPQAVQAFVNTYSQTFGYLNGSTIGIGLKLENNPGSGVLASVTFDPTQLGSYTEPTLGYKLTVNTAYLPSLTNSSLSTNDRNSLEVTIVHEMMHAFMDEALTNGMLGLDPVTHAQNFSANRFPGWFVEGMAQSAAGGCYNGNDWVNGGSDNSGASGLGLSASSTDAQITSSLTASNQKLSSDTTTARYGTGYLACMYLGWMAVGSPSSVTESSLKTGVDKVLAAIRGNATTDGISLDAAIKQFSGNKYTSLSDFETKFGTAGDDSVSFVSKLVTAAGTTGTGGLIGGGFSSFNAATGILSDSDLSGISLFELNPAKGTVYNKYPNGYNALSGGIKNASGSGAPTSWTATGGTGGTGGTGTIAAGRTFGNGAALHIGADADMNNKLIVYIDAMDAESIGVSEVNVMTEDEATLSIERVSFAIAQVSKQRSALGAYQNRLEHTINNLDNIIENTTQAESTIRDTDMAEEMVKYSKNTILYQAGQSMLVQANQSNQGVLSLIA